MKTQTKTGRRQRKLSNHHEEEEMGRQTISALLLLSRVESAHLHLQGAPAPSPKEGRLEAGLMLGGSSPVQGLPLGSSCSNTWPQAGARQRGQRLHTPHVFTPRRSARTQPVRGSGKPQELAPYLLEVTLRGFAGHRLTGDNTAPASAVLAGIRLPERVILQIELETRPMQHKAHPVLTTCLK